MSILDNPGTYKNPLSIELLAAVGNVITCWAAIESSLPLQVGRLAAIYPEKGKLLFSPITFIRTAYLAGGASPRAIVAQLINLSEGYDTVHVTNLKKAGEKLLEQKQRRDDIAHLLGMPINKQTLKLRYLSASKSKPYAEKHFTAEEINGWTHLLKKRARKIDEVITEMTKWPWKRIKEEHGIGSELTPVPLES